MSGTATAEGTGTVLSTANGTLSEQQITLPGHSSVAIALS